MKASNIVVCVVSMLGLGSACASGGDSTHGSAPYQAGDDGGAAPDGPTSSDAGVVEPLIPSATQLQAWQTEIDQFDGGFRPTGSPAHEGYIHLLAGELTSLGVSGVHLEPYSFSKWTPTSWSLALIGGTSPGPVTVSGYVPYSGSTSALGVGSGLVYLPDPMGIAFASLDAATLQQALQNPTAWAQTVATAVRSSLSVLGGVAGKIVLFDVPRVTIPTSSLTGPTYLVNDPNSTLPSTVSPVGITTMLVMPGILSELAAEGAVGAVGILDCPEEVARGEYAPFFDVVPNVPALYVDRDVGAQLKTALAADPLVGANLVLQATVSIATSENVVGVIPGASTKEILLSTHTDGPNSIEDNGTVGILALASYFTQLEPSQRARTIRIVLSGGHFVGSLGLANYDAQHLTDLTTNALAVIELEHLGAREWAETTSGQMALTGLPEMQLLYTWANAPLVDAAKKFGQQFPRTVVAGPMPLGEGQNFHIVPLIQFITAPSYLLSGHLPQVTTELTDYAMMRTQLVAFAQMEASLASAPDGQLGVAP